MLATAAKFLFLVWHDRDLGGPARDGDLLAMIMNNSILPADSQRRSLIFHEVNTTQRAFE